MVRGMQTASFFGSGIITNLFYNAGGKYWNVDYIPGAILPLAQVPEFFHYFFYPIP